jgi:uncharacterized protein YyaL (SSP411 family)
LPNKVIAVLEPGTVNEAEMVRRVPLLAEKKMVLGKATAYVCRNYACQEPTLDPAALLAQLNSA